MFVVEREDGPQVAARQPGQRGALAFDARVHAWKLAAEPTEGL
jgi:hypothetical protein